jgi:hypothetical protein
LLQVVEDAAIAVIEAMIGMKEGGARPNDLVWAANADWDSYMDSVIVAAIGYAAAKSVMSSVERPNSKLSDQIGSIPALRQKYSQARSRPSDENCVLRASSTSRSLSILGDSPNDNCTVPTH